MKPRRFIAVEIGADGIKLAEFSRHASGEIELLDHGEAVFEAGPQMEMAQEARVAISLKRLLDEKNMTAHSVAIALEGQSAFFRSVKLPPVLADKQEQTIRHEAVQNIPFPINEVVWDFHRVGWEDMEPEVLLVAVKADLAGGMAHAVGAAGLSPEIIDVAPIALANAVHYNYPELTEPVLIVGMGSRTSNLVFIDGERTFFRNIPVSGKMLDRLGREIDQSIAFYCKQQHGQPPKRVLLAGESNGEGSLEHQLSERLEMPVERLDPLRKIACGSAVKADGLGVLVGMAVRMAASCAVEINLVPEALRKKLHFQRREPLMVAGLLFLVLVVGTWAAGLSRLTGLVRQEAVEVALRVDALEEAEQRLVPLERTIAGFERRGQVYSEAIERRTVWLEALIELRACLPEGMFLSATEPLRDGVVLTGLRITVVSYLDKEPEGEDAVVLLRDRLRASRWFGEGTKVVRRPTKKLFARSFEIDVVLEEPASR